MKDCSLKILKGWTSEATDYDAIPPAVCRIVSGRNFSSCQDCKNRPLTAHKPDISAAKRIQLKWQRIHPGAVVPSYEHDGDSGFDLRAIEDMVIAPGERKLVRTGLKVEIPPAYEMQIRPKSGISLKTPLMIANSPGTVDSCYRGEICIIVFNSGKEPAVIPGGMKIAQGVIQNAIRAECVEAEYLSPTERGEDGFGSTGL